MTEQYDEQKLYLMENDFGLIKIGISKDPTRRCRELQNASGTEVKILNEFKVPAMCGSSYELEQSLHKQFKNLRKKGEWFEKSCLKDLLECIKNSLDITHVEVGDNRLLIDIGNGELAWESLISGDKPFRKDKTYKTTFVDFVKKVCAAYADNARLPSLSDLDKFISKNAKVEDWGTNKCGWLQFESDDFANMFRFYYTIILHRRKTIKLVQDNREVILEDIFRTYRQEYLNTQRIKELSPKSNKALAYIKTSTYCALVSMEDTQQYTKILKDTGFYDERVNILYFYEPKYITRDELQALIETSLGMDNVYDTNKRRETLRQIESRDEYLNLCSRLDTN